MFKMLFSASLLLSLTMPAQAAGNPDAGREKSAVCASCHGMDGNSISPAFPSLAGQHAAYITKQLQDYKSGARNNPTMKGRATPLSEQDMLDLAAYFAAQTAKGGSADKDLVEQGQSLYRGGNPTTGVPACASCHSPSGAGNPAARFPALAGQHAQYTAAQLKYFKSGERANDAGKMMRSVAAHMSEDEIQAVANYIQGLY